MILGVFAGAAAMLVLMAVIAGLDWLLHYQPAPDEHRAVTPHIELYEMGDTSQFDNGL